MTAGGAGIPPQRVAAEDPTTLASPRAVPSNRSGGGRETGDDSSPAVLRTNSSTRQTRKLGTCLVPLSPRNLVVDLDSWLEGCHSQTPVAVEKLHAPSPRWLSLSPLHPHASPVAGHVMCLLTCHRRQCCDSIATL